MQIGSSVALLSIDVSSLGLSDIVLSVIPIYAAAFVQVAIMLLGWKCYKGTIFPSAPRATLSQKSSRVASDASGDADERQLLRNDDDGDTPHKEPLAARAESDSTPKNHAAESAVSINKISTFVGPLMLTELVQRISRPVGLLTRLFHP